MPWSPIEAVSGIRRSRRADGTAAGASRRKWATERKPLPDVDVAAAGGWSDTATLKLAYQQADEATMFRVVSEPAELREA